MRTFRRAAETLRQLMLSADKPRGPKTVEHTHTDRQTHTSISIPITDTRHSHVSVPHFLTYCDGAMAAITCIFSNQIYLYNHILLLKIIYQKKLKVVATNPGPLFRQFQPPGSLAVSGTRDDRTSSQKCSLRLAALQG